VTYASKLYSSFPSSTKRRCDVEFLFGGRKNMKSISASIIVIAGSALILGGSYIPHSDTKLFVQIVGCGVSVVGLWGWFTSLKEK